MGSDERPGFYSLTHVDPADSVTIRPFPKGPGLTTLDEQLVAAVKLLEENGYKVMPKAKGPTRCPLTT